MDERVRNLPKWARDLIEKLSAENATMSKTVAVALGRTPPGSGRVELPGNNYQNLSDRARVQFSSNFDTTRNALTVYFDEAEGELHICGEQTITLMPQAANYIRVKMSRE